MHVCTRVRPSSCHVKQGADPIIPSLQSAEKVIAELNGKQVGKGDAAFMVSIKLANPPVHDRGAGGRGGRGGGRFGRGGRGAPPAFAVDPEKADLLRILRDQVRDVEKHYASELKVVRAEELTRGGPENGVNSEGGKEAKRKAVLEVGGEEKRAKLGGEARVLKSIPAEVAPMGEWLLKAGAFEVERKGGAESSVLAGEGAKLDEAKSGERALQGATNKGGRAEGAEKVNGKHEPSKMLSVKSEPVEAEELRTNDAQKRMSEGEGKASEATLPQKTPQEGGRKADVAPVNPMENGLAPRGPLGAASVKVQSLPVKPVTTPVKTEPTTGTAPPGFSGVKRDTKPVSASTAPLTAPVTVTNPSPTATAPVAETRPALAGLTEAATEGPVNERVASADTMWDCPLCMVANADEAELATHRATKVHQIVERLRNGPKPLVKSPLSLLHEYAVKRRAEVRFGRSSSRCLYRTDCPVGQIFAQ